MGKGNRNRLTRKQIEYGIDRLEIHSASFDDYKRDRQIKNEDDVYLDGRLGVYGVDDDDDVLVKAPCTHTLGVPLSDLKEAAQKGVIVLKCPECTGNTFFEADLVLRELYKRGMSPCT